MDNFLASLFHDIFSDIMKNSSKQFRYYVVTVCTIILLVFGIIVIFKQQKIEIQVFISILMIFCLFMYVFVMVKIYKNEKRKNNKRKK